MHTSTRLTCSPLSASWTTATTYLAARSFHLLFIPRERERELRIKRRLCDDSQLIAIDRSSGLVSPHSHTHTHKIIVIIIVVDCQCCRSMRRSPWFIHTTLIFIHQVFFFRPRPCCLFLFLFSHTSRFLFTATTIRLYPLFSLAHIVSFSFFSVVSSLRRPYAIYLRPSLWVFFPPPLPSLSLSCSRSSSSSSLSFVISRRTKCACLAIYFTVDACFTFIAYCIYTQDTQP